MAERLERREQSESKGGDRTGNEPYPLVVLVSSSISPTTHQSELILFDADLLCFSPPTTMFTHSPCALPRIIPIHSRALITRCSGRLCPVRVPKASVLGAAGLSAASTAQAPTLPARFESDVAYASMLACHHLDPAVVKLATRAAACEPGLPRISTRSVLLNLLALLVRDPRPLAGPQCVLELGTGMGLSSLALAGALPKAEDRVFTLEGGPGSRGTGSSAPL